MPQIVFHVGGPDFHPVAQQARLIQQWIAPHYHCSFHDGVHTFDHLDDADLLVLMGLHWTGMQPALPYRPMQPRHQQAFTSYIGSGRPIIAHHGAIASYDDWPEFRRLIGFTWIWGKTNHSPIGDYTVNILPTNHPITTGLCDFSIHDELYYDIAITEGLNPATHATARFNRKDLPMILTATGGRTKGA